MEKSKFNIDAFNKLVDSLTLRLTRRQADGKREPITHLPNDGVMSKAEVLGLEQVIVKRWGGGTFEFQVLDANGTALEWENTYPGPAVIPPEQRAEVIFAQQASQAGAQQAAYAAATGMPMGMASQMPFSPPMPVQGGGLPAPVNPYGQPQMPGQWPGMPGQQPQMPGQFNTPPWQQPYGAPPWGQPSQMPNWGNNGPWGNPMFGSNGPWGNLQWGALPPQVPTTAADDARLRALETQNNQLREDAIRRQANEGVQMLTSRLEALATQTNTRFEQLMSKLGERNPNLDERYERERAEAQRKEDLAHIEQQRREDEFKRELKSLADESKRQEERIRNEMSQAQQQNASASLMQTVLAQQAAQSASSLASIEGLYAKFAPMLITPEKVLALAKEIVPGKDAITEKLAAVALDQLAGGGGGGGMAQVVAQLGSAVLETGTKIAQTVIDSKASEANTKTRADADARARLDVQLRRAQQPRQQLPPPQAAGGANGAQAQPQQAAQARQQAQPSAQAQPEPQLAGPPVEQRPVQADETAEQLQAEDEIRYFGPAWPYIHKLRAAVAAGFLTPERVVDIVVTEYVRNVGDWEMKPPVFDDVESNPHRAVRRALPDASGAFRAKVSDMLPVALKEAIEEWKKAGEEEEAEAKARAAAEGEPAATA